VKTIQGEIFWQYAELVCKSAGFGIKQSVPADRFIALRDGKIKWLTATSDWGKEHKKPCFFACLNWFAKRKRLGKKREFFLKAKSFFLCKKTACFKSFALL
jgi:hypothetical protein